MNTSSWKQFETSKPELAKFGKERFAKGVAYLGTIQKDGSPRVHPVTPIISPENLLLIALKKSVNSTKNTEPC